MEKKWWHNKVAYQIYPKSFNDLNGDGIGDVRGIIQKLDYLKSLGVDIIWISPIYQSPMVDQGYDISDYYNIHPSFGTMEDMEELLREIKKRDMYLLMDLVINHCSDQHEWFQKAIEDLDSEYADYFYIKEGKDGNPPTNWRSYFGGSAWEKIGDTNKYYLHMFAKEQPDLNWENEKVRTELYKMVNWWLEKGIDGFRIDAIINIKKQLEFKNYEPDGIDQLSGLHKMLEEVDNVGEFLTELRDQTFKKYDAFTVAEVFNDKPGELEKFIGEDGYFSTIFDFTMEKERSGETWEKSPRLSGEEVKKLIFQAQKESESVGFRANIIENHDEPRGATVFLPEGKSTLEGIKMLGTISMLLKGIPFIYQGQEIGMTNVEFTDISEIDDISTKDQYQIMLEKGYTAKEALRIVNEKSRDNSRTPFQWNGEENAGFTTGTPWLKVNPNYVTVNVEKEEKEEDSILSYYKKLIKLRKTVELEDAFVYGRFQEAYESKENILAYYRIGDEHKVLVIANYQEEKQQIVIEDTVKQLLLSNYDRKDTSFDTIELNPYEVVVLEILN